jgi:hypothetical protein
MPKTLPANGQLMLAGYGEYVTDVVRVGHGAYPREREVAREALQAR